MIPCPACSGTGHTGGGIWFRPGPLFESRALGRWPSAGTYGVWSDLLFAVAESLRGEWTIHQVPEIGCDPARFGDDFTSMIVRWGSAAVHHERHNGWALDQTAGRLKQLCRQWCEIANRDRQPNQVPWTPQDVLVKIDVDGLGSGVVDQAGEYTFVGVSGAMVARNPDDYPNLRSQLWFNTVEQAFRNGVGFGRLPKAALRLLRQQALAPVWKPDGQGRCLVEPKADTKKRLGASPDDMDSVNLAFWNAAPFTAPGTIENPRPDTRPQRGNESEAARQHLFGKGRRR